MKTILMSIRPEWVYKIFTGQKTIDLRKTAPKPPFRVVVYCTQGEPLLYRSEATKGLYLTNKGKEKALAANGHTVLNGKAIGEFICEKVDEISVHNDIVYSVGNVFADKLKSMRLSVDELKDYLGAKNSGYAIGISSPKLYDKPKELSRFYTSLPDKILDSGDYDCRLPGDILCIDAPEGGDHCPDCKYGGRKAVSRPPQSWQYIIDPEAAE